MKKFLKVFSVLAVICCSMFVFTGCTINLSEEQKQKVLTVVDNADVFMDDVLENLDKSNSKLGREESFKKITDAYIKLSLNVGNLWSNMKLTYDYVIDKEANNVISFCKVKDGNYMCHYASISDDSGLPTEFIHYADIDAVVEPESSPKTMIYEKHPNGYVRGDVSNYCFLEGCGVTFNLINVNGFTEEDVITTDVLDNGNNYISLYQTYSETIEDLYGDEEEIIETVFFEIEFKDDLIKKVTIHMGTTYIGGEEFTSEQLEDMSQSNPEHVTITYEYGTVNLEEMEVKYKEAKDYIDSHVID